MKYIYRHILNKMYIYVYQGFPWGHKVPKAPLTVNDAQIKSGAIKFGPGVNNSVKFSQWIIAKHYYTFWVEMTICLTYCLWCNILKIIKQALNTHEDWILFNISGRFDLMCFNDCNNI